MKANGIFCVKLQIQGREAFRLLKRARLKTYGDDVVFISDELVIAIEIFTEWRDCAVAQNLAWNESSLLWNQQ